MALEVITQENNPDRFAALQRLWLAEHKPGYLTTGRKTYQVVQNVQGGLEFREIADKTLYDSTSF